MVELPGYTIEEELGRGGVGVVYAARQVETGRPVAIKILQPDVPESARRRFRREADAARAAVHPGIVPVHESGEHGDLLYLVMDRIDGKNLQEKLDRDGPLPSAEAVRIVGEIAQAVQALHDAGVVHRDIKPANVLLTADGQAKLTDFGIAEPPLDSATVHGLTQDSQWLRSASAESSLPAGTYAYMAPEQWRGETVDARADVYGLGSLLFSALTASPPFTGRTLPELVYAVILSDTPTANAGAGLDAVIATALARDPEDRFASAIEFRDAMIRGKVDKRRRPVRWLITGGVAVVALATTVLLISLNGGDEARTLTVCAKDITLRPEPRSQAVVANVAHGEKVRVIESGGTPNWLKVETDDGRQGWAVVNFLGTSC